MGHKVQLLDATTELLLRVFKGPRPSAGFPSPAGDYIESRIDLNKELIKHPAATFVVHVQGNSMIGAGIHTADRLIVDRSLKPEDGSIVVGSLNGELVVKRLRMRDQKLYLLSENPGYAPIPVAEGNDFEVWGVPTYAIHKI